MTNTPLYDRSGALYLPVSLRDHFAAVALPMFLILVSKKLDFNGVNEAAEASYQQADAMLAARAKETLCDD